MKKIPILSFLLIFAVWSFSACALTQTADKITIHTENGSIQNFESKEAVLTSAEDISKLQNEIKKFTVEAKNPSQTQLVGATEYLIELHNGDKLESIYSLYGETFTHYSDPTNNKVKRYQLTSQQQKRFQELLEDYLN